MNTWLLMLVLLTGSIQSSDLSNSKIHFKIGHLGVLKVTGTFDEIEANLEKTGSNSWFSKGNVVVKSIDTGSSSRDKTILTEQYFDANAYPTIPFEATVYIKDKTPQLTVNLRVRGNDLQLVFELIQKDGWLISKPAKFSRSKIGLDFGGMDTLIGDEVEIIVHSGIRYKSIFDHQVPKPL